MRTYLLESAARSLHRFYDSVDPAETDLRQQLCAIGIRLEQVRRQLTANRQSKDSKARCASSGDVACQ
jgi:hypothetical protein